MSVKNFKAQVSENPKIQYLIVFVFALAVYSVSCAPTILWQDSGLFIYRIWHHDFQGPLGLALAHPVYILIGILLKYVQIGEFAARINLISSIFGAVTIANVFLLSKFLFQKSKPAIIAATALTFSWTFWFHSAVAEVYTLYSAQMTGVLILLFLYIKNREIKFLYSAALLNGLAVANHMWGTFTLACLGIYWLYLLKNKDIKPKQFLILIVLWVIGCLPYEILIIRELIQGTAFLEVMYSTFFGSHWDASVTNPSFTLKIVLENFIFIALNFPSPLIILIFAGLYFFIKSDIPKAFKSITLILFLLFFAFAFRYKVPDRHAFFLPAYVIASVFLACGVNWLLNKTQKKYIFTILFMFAILPTIVYTLTPYLAKKVYPVLGKRRQRPYRDEYVYFLQPWKTCYYGAERFATEALNSVEKDAAIYCDFTSVHTLYYVQEVKKIRQDVKILTSYGIREKLTEEKAENLVKNSNLYVFTPVEGYCPDFLLENYEFVKKGVLYKVVRK